MSVVVDALGKQCPIPVVMAKKALAELQTPDTLEILVDNEAAVQNLSKLAASCQLPVRAEKTETAKTLGAVLKQHRTACKMTQEFVAESIGVSRQAVSKWESGGSLR